MRKYPNNNPVGDFFCKPCSYDFELKAKKNSLGKKIVDGAYDTLIQRIISASSPNFIVLAYSPALKVTNCLVIPNYYFVPSIVEKRKPLSATARRAGRVGSTILLTHIPES